MFTIKGANFIESGHNSKFWELPLHTIIVEATLKTNHWNQEELGSSQQPILIGDCDLHPILSLQS